jgi:predicted nucleic acid-binding protein
MADQSAGEDVGGELLAPPSETAHGPLVLADTSVWELAQKGNSRAETALSDLARVSQLATCAIVAGEVMFGTPPPARNVVAVRARLGELVVLTASP